MIYVKITWHLSKSHDICQNYITIHYTYQINRTTFLNHMISVYKSHDTYQNHMTCAKNIQYLSKTYNNCHKTQITSNWDGLNYVQLITSFHTWTYETNKTEYNGQGNKNRWSENRHLMGGMHLLRFVSQTLQAFTFCKQSLEKQAIYVVSNVTAQVQEYYFLDR